MLLFWAISCTTVADTAAALADCVRAILRWGGRDFSISRGNRSLRMAVLSAFVGRCCGSSCMPPYSWSLLQEVRCLFVKRFLFVQEVLVIQGILIVQEVLDLQEGWHSSGASCFSFRPFLYYILVADPAAASAHDVCAILEAVRDIAITINRVKR